MDLSPAERVIVTAVATVMATLSILTLLYGGPAVLAVVLMFLAATTGVAAVND